MDRSEENAGGSRRWARILAVALVVLAVPPSLLFLTPAMLKAMADPFDPALAAPQPAALSLTFLDAEDKVIGRQGPVTGLRLSLPEMPAYLAAAFLAVEDRRFFSHDGVDLMGMARAVRANWRAGRVVAGGSTISQQTAKLLTGERERTYGRKWRELMITAALEKRYSKRQILELYLNHIYLGDGAQGVDAASRAYFGVPARQVTVAQAAMLAGLARAPSLDSPRRDPVRAQARANRVLAAMEETGAISREQASVARMNPPVLVPAQRDDHSYVLDAAANEARHILAGHGVSGGAYLVHTTMNATLQAVAEKLVVATVRDGGRQNGFGQAALVVMTPQGAISAMVGGVDYGASVFNRVMQAKRQPGSAFKPFVYTAALERGISPWDWRDGSAVNIDGYQPANYRNASYGMMQLSDALARSVNTVTVSLAQEVGLTAVASTARRLGIVSKLHPWPSLALGTEVVTPLELTAAYAAFANRGAKAEPHLVARLEGAFDGATLYQRGAPANVPVLADSVRRDMTAMLYQVVQAGTGTGARLGVREAAGKTGTSQAYRDAWFVGFTTDFVAGVWVGNDDNSPMRNVTGGRIPASLWRQVMLAAEGGRAPQALDRSEKPVQEPMEDYVGDVLQAIAPDDDRPVWRPIRDQAYASSPAPVSAQRVDAPPGYIPAPANLPAMTFRDYGDRYPAPYVYGEQRGYTPR
jgi:penicillin-binding protein 1A